MKCRKFAGQTHSGCFQASMQQSSFKHVSLAYFSSGELFSYLENGECLDVSGVRDVGTTAEIDQRTASIYCTLGSVGNALVDEVKLVFAVLEHLNKLLLGHLETLKWLLLLDDGAGNVLQCLLILFGNDLAAKSVSTDLCQGQLSKHKTYPSMLAMS